MMLLRTTHAPLAVTLLAAVVASVGCGDWATSPPPPDQPTVKFTGVGMRMITPEGSATRHILAVGDTGRVLAWDEKEDPPGCYLTPWPPCGSSLTNLPAHSSNTDILTEPEYEPGDRWFVAEAVGTGEIVATSHGFTTSETVEVVPSYLPVDSIRMRAEDGQDPYFPPKFDVDSEGNILSVTLPQPEKYWTYANVRVVAFWAADSTVFLPVAFESSNLAVVRVEYLCRERDPRPCRVPESTSVNGVTSGTATVTVTGGGQRYAFDVTVE